MKNYIRFKAGSVALGLISEEGLAPERIRVFAAPAGGPKWFVSVGFDRGLMSSRFLERSGRRVLLAGSSAGAWRCLAFMTREPLDAYEKLRLAYSRNTFTAADTPMTISAKLYENVKSFLTQEDIPFILDHSTYDLAIHAVRSRGPAAAENSLIQGTALLCAAAMNIATPRAMDLVFERIVFFTGNEPKFPSDTFYGRKVRLTEENLRPTALATGSLPYIMTGVKDIPAAPKGVYRDGGVLDYQLRQDYMPDDGITLFLHYQERIVPGWFDKSLAWRKPSRSALERVLQVYPGDDFIKLLPDGRLPDRKDFTAFVDDPTERIRRWDETCELSGILWEEFMNAVESGSIRDSVRLL